MTRSRTRQQLREFLEASVGDEEPMFLSPADLELLLVGDVPEKVAISVGLLKDGVHHIDWDGELRIEDGAVVARVQHLNTRKYWYSPVGLLHYMDLVRRSIETRARTIGDVAFGELDDDGAYVNLHYEVRLGKDAKNLRAAYVRALKIERELNEAAEDAEREVGRLISVVAQRVSRWGAEPLDGLVDAVDTSKSTDDKGRALEELAARLFATIPGFTVTDRLRTETEEIDLAILNDSADARFKREDALLLVECKNWSSKCGKNEFVIFKEKVENRSQRCSLGFLVSWNGFAETVTKEMLRGSRERTLIVPLIGEQLRRAARAGSFADELHAAWLQAVNT